MIKKAEKKLPPAAKLLLIEIKKYAVNRICTLKDQQLADKIGKSRGHTALLLKKLRDAKKIRTTKTGSTEREIEIIDEL
jgi:hypothetical protein